MRTGLLITCIVFIITGCKNKNRIPAGIIPQKEMQAILWDMMRADQFLGDYVLNRDTSHFVKEESIKIYSRVLSIHQVSKEQFGKSFSFYKSHPSLFRLIMDSISQLKTFLPVELPPEPARVDSLIQIPKRRTDSIIPLRKKKGFPLK